MGFGRVLGIVRVVRGVCVSFRLGLRLGGIWGGVGRGELIHRRGRGLHFFGDVVWTRGFCGEEKECVNW